MPCVLTHEDGRTTPWRVERVEFVAALDESLLIEQPVRWQEYLAMHVHHVWRFRPKRDVHGAVEERVLEDLVEADDDVEARHPVRGTAPRVVEIARERSSRHREIAHSPFHEVAGERRLRQMENLRPRPHAVHLRKHFAEPREVRGIVALGGLDLSDCQMNERPHVMGKMLVRLRPGQCSRSTSADARGQTSGVSSQKLPRAMMLPYLTSDS